MTMFPTRSPLALFSVLSTISEIALEHLALLTVGLPTSLCGLGNIEPHRKPGLGG